MLNTLPASPWFGRSQSPSSVRVSPPPLTPRALAQVYGHEIVAILCGLVWGLGPGFGIVAAGTFLGELGNF